MSGICGLFSSEVAAAWATAAFTLLLAVVAGFQLGRFSDSERTKYTMSQITAFFDGKHHVDGGEPMTVQTAMSTVTAIMTQGLTDDFMKASRRYYSGARLDPFQLYNYSLQANCLIIATNYFGIIASLHKRRFIDTELLVAKFAGQLVDLATFCDAVSGVEPDARAYLADPENIVLTALGRIEYDKQMAQRAKNA